MLYVLIVYITTIILVFSLALALGIRFFSSIILSLLVGIITYLLLSPNELADFSDDSKKALVDITVFTVTGGIFLFYIILCVISDVETRKR